MDESLFPPWLIIFAFPIFFVLLWIIITAFTSWLGGWARLAGYYAALSPFSGQKRTMQSGYLNWARYRGVLTLGANESGLYLAVMVLFRVGHPPLLIPWHDITVTVKKGILGTYMVLTFAKVPGMKLRIRRGVGDDWLWAQNREHILEWVE
jgi:hypothetical protein